MKRTTNDSLALGAIDCVGEGVQVDLAVFAAAWAGPIVEELVGDCVFPSGTETTADGNVIDRTGVGICPGIPGGVLGMPGESYCRLRIDSDFSKRAKYW